MNYYKYFDDENFDYPLTCFAELDSDYYCVRAVYQTPKGLFNTYVNAVENEHFLPEGSWVDILEFNEISNVKEFGQIWLQSMQPFENQWQNLKNHFQINQPVSLKLVCFYPQGIILKFDETFYALANFEHCKMKFGKDKLSVHQYLDVKISGFDDVNKIVLVT